MEKIDECLEFPFHWMRALTIPPCEDENYDNRLIILWPWLGLPAAYILLTMKNPLSNYYVLGGFVVFDLLWSGYHFKC